MFFGKGSEKGQVLLVVILASVIALTVGLAAVSRTITNTKLTTEEENSQKALSAAEAGVEELAGNASLLATGTTGNRTLSNQSTFKADATQLGVSSPFALNGGQTISKDDGADVWLSNYPDYSGQWYGTLTLYWVRNSDCSQEAAIETVILYGNSTNSPSVARYAVDRCASSRSSSNSFTSTGIGSQTVGGVTYNTYSLPAIASSAPGYIARVIPLYQNTKILIGYTSPPSLPSQGNVITSTGASGNTKRTVQVFKGYPRVPIEFFPYNLFLPQ